MSIVVEPLRSSALKMNAIRMLETCLPGKEKCLAVLYNETGT
mgnify:CR=1 FL=1